DPRLRADSVHAEGEYAQSRQIIGDTPTGSRAAYPVRPNLETMGADALGGGVLVAAAAVLWLAYLLPTWLHRRQYVTSERNAVRLQQTLRVLAETAEAPRVIVVE